MSHSRIALFAAVALACAAPAYAGDLIANGNFETGDLSSWAVSGAVANASEADYGVCCGFTSTHPDNRVAAFGGGGQGPTESLSQSFLTDLGAAYTLTFDLGAVGSSNINTVDVSVGGASQHFDLSGVTDFDAAFGHYGLAFTGTGHDTVTFTVGSFFNDDIDTVLDNVSIAVPEPATWALMIGGFGMAGAMLRRRRMVLARA